MSGLALYILSLLMVALVLNWEPFLPPVGSGLWGLVDAADFVIDEPFLPWAALAAMNLLFVVLKFCFLFDPVYPFAIIFL